jgi:hypothetical protein
LGETHFVVLILLDCKKNTIRIIMGIRNYNPNIYYHSLFVIHSKNYFQLHSEIYGINTRTISNLHWPLPHLKTYQKGKYYFRNKVFSSWPTEIKDLSYNTKLFQLTLKSYLYFHSFYTVQEYFNYNRNQNP